MKILVNTFLCSQDPPSHQHCCLVQRPQALLLPPDFVAISALLLQMQYGRKGGVCQSRKGWQTCSPAGLHDSSELPAGFVLFAWCCSFFMAASLPSTWVTSWSAWSLFPYKASDCAVSYCISCSRLSDAFTHNLNHFNLGTSEATLRYFCFLLWSQWVLFRICEVFQNLEY